MRKRNANRSELAEELDISILGFEPVCSSAAHLRRLRRSDQRFLADS